MKNILPLVLVYFFWQSFVFTTQAATTTEIGLVGPVFLAPASSTTVSVLQGDTTLIKPKKEIVSSVSSCIIQKQTFLLQRGSKDGTAKNVSKLQNFLYAEGYLKAVPNGYFGPGTHAAVRSFQKEYGYKVTGIVGPYTLAKINELNCGLENELDGQVSVSSVKVKNENLAPVVESRVVPVESSFGVSSLTSSSARPIINNFVIAPNSAGSHFYNAKIDNLDALSVRAICPVDIVEVRTLVGLTKQKIATADTFCGKEKYLFLSEQGPVASFERKDSPLVFTDREGVPSWLAFDASTTPSTDVVNYVVKACLKSNCVQRTLTTKITDFYQKVISKDLSLSDIRIDEKQNLFFTAYNVNNVTVKAGCPYNVQALGSAGEILDDANTTCNLEKTVLDSANEIVPIFDKQEGVPLQSLGLNFEMKNVNGQIDPYANVEINIKGCSGISSESVASSTLRCVERAVYFPIQAKR